MSDTEYPTKPLSQMRLDAKWEAMAQFHKDKPIEIISTPEYEEHEYGYAKQLLATRWPHILHNYRVQWAKQNPWPWPTSETMKEPCYCDKCGAPLDDDGKFDAFEAQFDDSDW